MFNNVFKKKDPVADMIAQIAEADYKAKMEELKGQQHKLDKNKNNKLDADDFKILRGEKKTMKKEETEQVEEANKHSFIGKIQRHHELKKKVDQTWKDAADAEQRGDKKDADRAFNKHVRYANLERPGTWRTVKEEQDVAEANNPFDVKNYKSQLKSKPGEKAGFDSKKISTGTVYSKKPVKDEPMKKEEIDPNNTTTDTLKGREKTSDNKFLSKKVMMDVPDNVKEDVEQIEERELSKGETAEKERIVKGMKKSLSGFKKRYGERAKEVMYATATKAAKKD